MGASTSGREERKKLKIIKKVRNERPIPLHSSFGKARSPRACPGARLPVRQPGNSLLARLLSEFGISESTAVSQACSLTPFYCAVWSKAALKRRESTRTVANPSYLSRRQVRNRPTHLLIGGKQQRNRSRRPQSASPKSPLPHVFGNFCRLVPCNLGDWVMDPTYLAVPFNCQK